jgi:hypothetical protein
MTWPWMPRLAPRAALHNPRQGCNFGDVGRNQLGIRGEWRKVRGKVSTGSITSFSDMS